jgi:hypothetical protein
LLEIFRKNLFINSVLLLPYIILVRLATFIYPQKYQVQENSSEIIKIIYLFLDNPLLQSTIAVVLIFIQAIIINHLFIKHRLSREITLLPGLIYVVFVTIVMDFTVLSPVLLGNTFIIFALVNLLKTYKLPNAVAFIFNSGFYISVASIFYTPYIFMVFFGVIILLILRSFKLLEKIQYFSGFIVPYFFLFTYRYLTDAKLADLTVLKEVFFRLPYFESNFLIVNYISIGFIILSVLVCLFNYGSLTGKKVIQTQKKVDVFYWVLLYSLVSFLIFSTEGSLHLLTLAVPLSVLTGILISDSKAKISHELLHFMVLALIFLTQFKLLVI